MAEDENRGSSQEVDEMEEAWAMRLVANGNGDHPLPKGGKFDEACVSFCLEDVDKVGVFLRKGGETLQAYHFKLVPDAPSSVGAHSVRDGRRESGVHLNTGAHRGRSPLPHGGRVWERTPCATAIDVGAIPSHTVRQKAERWAIRRRRLVAFQFLKDITGAVRGLPLAGQRPLVRDALRTMRESGQITRAEARAVREFAFGFLLAPVP
jgi:hypothetical protein